MKNKDFLYLSAYYILKFLVSILPNFILNFIAFVVAKIVFKLNKKHRKIIDINLQICFPQKDKKNREQLAFKIYKNFARFGIDCIKNQNTSKDKILKKVVFDDLALVEQILNAKKPLVFVTAHYGNWELLSLIYAAKFGKISIVGRALDSEVMDKILSKNRTQFDIELIDKTGALRKMLKALRSGRALGLLTDQDCANNESIRLEFFGKEVNFLLGASVIAKTSEAFLLPSFIYQGEEGKYHIKCFKALDASITSKEELTKYQAQCLEEMIKFKPDEFFFFHRRFKSYDNKIYEGL